MKLGKCGHTFLGNIMERPDYGKDGKFGLYVINILVIGPPIFLEHSLEKMAF